MNLLSNVEIPTLSFNDSTNAEAKLALQRKIKLKEAGIYELELIPKISDTLAKRIELEKAEILSQAQNLPREKNYLALDRIRGLGPKSAQRLNDYLSFED